MSLTLIQPVRVVAHHGESGSWIDLHDANGHVTTVHLPPDVADAWATVFDARFRAAEIEGAPA